MKLSLVFFIVAFLAMSAVIFDTAEACVGHDGTCHGDHGSPGDCCGGTYCHKNDPSWGEGKCYYYTHGK